MIGEEEFCRFIQRYEANKRIDAFFTEHHFYKEVERFFSKAGCAFNWYYTNFAVSERAKAREIKENYLFFKVALGGVSFPFNETDKIFIETLLEDKRNRVVLILGEHNKPWKAKLVCGLDSDGQVVFDDNYPEEADSFFAQILTLLNEPVCELGEAYPPTNPKSPKKYIELLYSVLDSFEKQEFLLGRRFIYELFYKWFRCFPVDLDAIVRIGGKVVVIEYKRKRPSKGNFIGPENTPETLIEIERQFSNDLKLLDKPEFKEVVEIMEKYGAVRQSNMPSYGLDIRPHSLFVRWCFRNAIPYYFIVWDHEVDFGDFSGKSRSSSMMDLDKWIFLTPQLIKGGYVLPKDLKGFSFTDGIDSGRDSYLRFQETISESHLNQISNGTSMHAVFSSLATSL
ncbi:hypothetical protein [uncultured Pseudoteredinibacter sp.]|uniref:hypothetical protein n=1 Tax=uncultured Pseudoteredinibacter sp. TaxID=1641701 RepID=UPI0026053299|nr:hypothetical protein [uncultured Pseudoteredinibacter sp.]